MRTTRAIERRMPGPLGLLAGLLAGSLAGFAALATDSDPAPKPLAISAKNGVSVIPFLLHNNHIRVRGTVNQSDSLWFLVDTGASNHALNLSTAKRLSIPLSDQLEAHGAGGSAAGNMVENVTIDLPGVRLHSEALGAIPLDGVALQTGLPCDGVVGHPLFANAIVEIDYAKSTLTVWEREGYRYEGKGESLPLTFQMNHPYVEAKVTLPGREALEGKFVLDTGSAMAVVLGPSFVEKYRAVDTVPRTLAVRMGGVGGAKLSSLGRIERLELGHNMLRQPIATFGAAGPGQTNAEGTVGNIGADILRRFKVTFDYAGSRMMLEPGPAFDEPFEADMSGLLLRVKDDGTRALEVVLVQPDSPAAGLPIAGGDVVEAVDGRPVTGPDLTAVRRILREPNRTVRLAVRRDQKRSELSLTTKKLI